jgi:hypothetical protein
MQKKEKKYFSSFLICIHENSENSIVFGKE